MSILPSQIASFQAEKPHKLPRAAHACLKLLRRLKHGALSVQLPDGSVQHFGQNSAQTSLHAQIHLHNWRVCAAALKSGDIGFAQGFIAGDWSTPALSDLLRLFIVNRREVQEVIYGSWLGRLAYRIQHLLHRNTRSNAKKNIHAHYDLGNAFYAQWLDPSMSYSSAWFGGNCAQPLLAAQMAKTRRALHMAGVQAGDRVLEIGCGWGALAQMAVTEFQAHVTGVTLSPEQLAFAQKRLSSLGQHGEQADLRLQDYRDIREAPFDALCSIEMIEAVGREYWPDYFDCIARLLKPGGRACIQAITIDDALFERYVRSTDFIQHYIFPGGCLPSASEFKKAAHAAGLELVDQFAFGQDYAETCRRWRAEFLHQRAAIMALGFDLAFMRTWEFYLSYCEAAFDARSIDVVQFTLVKR